MKDCRLCILQLILNYTGVVLLLNDTLFEPSSLLFEMHAENKCCF